MFFSLGSRMGPDLAFVPSGNFVPLLAGRASFGSPPTWKQTKPAGGSKPPLRVWLLASRATFRADPA